MSTSTENIVYLPSGSRILAKAYLKFQDGDWVFESFEEDEEISLIELPSHTELPGYHTVESIDVDDYTIQDPSGSPYIEMDVNECDECGVVLDTGNCNDPSEDDNCDRCWALSEVRDHLVHRQENHKHEDGKEVSFTEEFDTLVADLTVTKSFVENANDDLDTRAEAAKSIGLKIMEIERALAILNNQDKVDEKLSEESLELCKIDTGKAKTTSSPVTRAAPKAVNSFTMGSNGDMKPSDTLDQLNNWKPT